MLTLNEQLNDTYVAYGYYGAAAAKDQEQVKKLNYKASRSVAVKRAKVKGNKELYKNERWDMVDAAANDEKFIDKVDLKTLPGSLKNKIRDEVKKIIAQKKDKSNTIQTEITKLAAERQPFFVKEKTKAAKVTTATLGSEIEKIIKKQAKMFKMTIAL